MNRNENKKVLNPWYESVQSDVPLTQGDIILQCPILQWQSNPDFSKLKIADQGQSIKNVIDYIKADVIVMTQACDLSNNKVNNVILCPHISLDEYKEELGNKAKAQNQELNAKAWKKECNHIKDGYKWNLSMINSSDLPDIVMAHRIVDFSDIYTLPRYFLEAILKSQNAPRLRLLPPYREHLSQAFARYFMRVGLPNGVEQIWNQ
jgi:hypothetical protein